MNQGQNHQRRRPRTAALLIASGMVVLAGVMLWDSARLADLGGYSGVGPASMPRLVAIGLLILAGWTAVEGMRHRFPQADPQRVAPVIWVVAGLALQLLTLKIAGFSIATGLLFAFTARAFGKRTLALTIPLGIVLAFLIWLVFSQLLSLSLPAGWLETWVLSKG